MPVPVTVHLGLFQSVVVQSTRNWPKNCFCQAGSDGIVLPKGSLETVLESSEEQQKLIGAIVAGETPDKGYKTAFFEAFPRRPSTFIRGEGRTILEAEEKAWKQWLKIKNCSGHEFKREGRFGYGICAHCGLGRSDVFDTLDRCAKCGKSVFGENKGLWYCKRHFNTLKDHELSERNLCHRKEEEELGLRKPSRGRKPPEPQGPANGQPA